MASRRPLESVVVSCLPAAEAPVAAVLARFRAAPRWTCVLKWWIDEARLEPGAWTKLRLKERRCRISPDGQFMLYVASGPLGGPFSAMAGGAVAVSRLPWLAALTTIMPASISGGGPSRHALSAPDQACLWDMFRDVPRYYYTDEDWPTDLGPAWRRTEPDEFRDAALGIGSSRRIALAARAPIPGRSRSLVAVVGRKKDGWNSSGDRLQFFVESGGPPSYSSLHDITWAHPHRNGMILAATTAGRLQQLRLHDHADGSFTWVPEQDHDLSILRPSPRPAPWQATRPL